MFRSLLRLWFSHLLCLYLRLRFLNRLAHLKRDNTVEGSRRNIHEHYDLSNDFFRLFLDRRMVYSAAIYEHEDTPLEDAQMYALTFTIGGDGFVNVPLAGQIKAAGYTQSQLEKSIERKLVEEKIFTHPTATINVPGPPCTPTAGPMSVSAANSITSSPKR